MQSFFVQLLHHSVAAGVFADLGCHDKRISSAECSKLSADHPPLLLNNKPLLFFKNSQTLFIFILPKLKSHHSDPLHAGLSAPSNRYKSLCEFASPQSHT